MPAVGTWNFYEHGQWGNKGSGVRYVPYALARYLSHHNPLSLKQRVLARGRIEDAMGRVLEEAGAHAAPGVDAQRVAQDLLNESKQAGGTVQEATEYVKRSLDSLERGLAARVSRTSTELLQSGKASTYREAVRDAIAVEMQARWQRIAGVETDPRCSGGYGWPPPLRPPPTRYASPAPPAYTSAASVPTFMPGAPAATLPAPSLTRARPTATTTVTSGGSIALGPAATATRSKALQLIRSLVRKGGKPTKYTLPGGGVKSTALTGLGYAQRSIAERTVSSRMEGLGREGEHRPFVEWFTDSFSSRSGHGAGERTANLFADWQCSPVNTMIGAAITSIWLGPAGGAGAASTATEIQRQAGCGLWAQARRLAAQEGLTRGQAIDLIQAGAWIEDPRTRTWYKSGSVSGIWVRVRPYAPYAAAAAGALLLLSKI